jgi:hypothetical protein
MKPNLWQKGSPGTTLRYDYKARAADLRATQLYRMLDEAISVDDDLVWRGRRSDVPLPLNDNTGAVDPTHGFDSDEHGNWRDHFSRHVREGNGTRLLIGIFIMFQRVMIMVFTIRFIRCSFSPKPFLPLYPIACIPISPVQYF